ncbi:MAG: undecaprenyl/decaprenyl-phosphate alpha-N-acetylglucosaminyl 1-phosphate transferase [Acidimicrobiia bacterium]|nr:undecaprenyl/decaprenyl-phosphate alpha-N-acetylglucosaminyl 1-phosphate transferase [Acidimicrobiia bacterium]
MLAGLLALVLTAALAGALVRFPALAGPFTRAAAGARWRADAVPLAGGLAMAVGCGLAVAVFGRDLPGAGAVLAAAGTALAVGLADDLHPLPAWAKVAGQAGAGVVLAALGVRAALPGPEVMGWLATVAWVVVAANALNLFDNFDGAAGGAALIAAVAAALWWGLGTGPTALAAALAGATAGFLIWNAPPARLFMGDAGSHFLGTALAGLTLVDAGRVGQAVPAPWGLTVGVPVVLLAIPLFDTALVVLERRRHRRPLSVGGRDHTSHRLAALGLASRRVALILWGLTAAAAGVASLGVLGWGWFTAGAALLAVGLTALGVRLARVRAYD